MKNVFIIMLTALCGLAAGGHRAQAQSIDDLGVVWSKHYGSGWIRGVKAQPDGSYLACGTGKIRTEGLVIEIDESGNEVRRLTATIPSSYPGTIPTNNADLVFKAAFKTSDGGVLAFGEFMNIDAPYVHKQYTWGITAPNEDPRHFNQSEYLLDGVWIVKFSSAGAEVRNELTRGRGITDAWRTNDEYFLLGGFDANATNDQDTTNTGKNITLLRKYNHNGDTIRDLRMDRREVTSFYQYPDGSFLITTPDRLFRINADLTTVGPAVHYYDYPNGPSLFPGANNPFANSISPNSEGGAFISTNLYSVAGDHSAYETALNGVGLYKLDANNNYVYHKAIIPSDTILSAPLLLPGADSIYVGTATLRDTSSITLSVWDTAHVIYEWSDIDATYAFRTGAAYPTGTTLMAVSQVDGFFSAGKNQGIGEAAIAKLSTCAKFKVDVGETTETYNGSGAFMLPARTVAYEGDQGTVDVKWELTDVTPDGAAADLPTPSPSGSGVNIPAQTVSLKQGKDLAMLRYTITAVDNYTTNGVPQKCQQTSTILIRIYRHYPDNILKAECYVNPPATAWGIDNIKSNEADLSPYQVPLVGDMNNDGIPEIVTATGLTNTPSGGTTYDRAASKIAIYKGNDISAAPKTFSTVKPLCWDSRNKTALFKTKIADKDTVLLAVIEMDSVLRAYNYDGATVWQSEKLTRIRQNGNVAAPSIADLNSDGLPEILYVGHVFNSATGARICSAPGTNVNDLMAVDVFNTGKLNCVQQNVIYDVTVDGANAITALTQNKSLTAPTFAANDVDNPYGQAFTPSTNMRINYVDIDNDGKMDAVFQGNGNVTVSGTVRRYNVVYIIDPHTNTVKARYLFEYDASATGYGSSLQFIGDMDGDGLPEIAFIRGGTPSPYYNMEIVAMKYNSQAAFENRLSVFWTLPHTDTSLGTSITMFDFNQDGKQEIIYRDEQNLYIIDGSTSSPQVSAAIENRSGTSAEYPVVADVNGDGRAEITIVGAITSDPGWVYWKGRLWVYKSLGANNTWAPARKVWNQYYYHPTQVNEDLSIPLYPLYPPTVFPGKNGIPGDADDVRPYNNFWQQQTTINQDGVPFYTAADAKNYGSPRFHYYAEDDSMVVAVPIISVGDAGLEAPFYVSVLKKLATDTTFIANGSTTNTVVKGAVDTVTVRIPDFSTYIPFDTLLVKLNSQDGLVYDQAECDTVDNRATFGAGDLLLARNDTVATVATIPVTIPVLKNDSIPAACRSSLEPPVVVGILRGTAELADDSIRYTYGAADPSLLHDPHFVDFDTITYRITCGADTSTAKVYIVITAFPDNISDEADCVVEAKKIDWSIRETFKSDPSRQKMTAYTTPIVGDLDGDGIPEVIVYNYHDDADPRPVDSVYVFWGKDRANPTRFFIPQTSYMHPMGALARVEIGGKLTPMLVFQALDGYLYAYNPATGDPISTWNGGNVTGRSDAKVNGWVSNTGQTAIIPQAVGFTDFDGDGFVEVYASHCVWAAENGKLLVRGNGNQGYVKGSSYYANTSYNNYYTVAADVDDDGIADLAAGTQVYEVHTPYRNGTHTTNTMEVKYKIPTQTVVYTHDANSYSLDVGDGTTVVADIDKDGKLDIIVSNNKDEGTYSYGIVVWDPRKEEVIATGGYISSVFPATPFTGNIDKDPNMEIVYIVHNRLDGWRYDGSKTLKRIYKMSHTDESGATGITLFDFNNDSVPELVYRDETRLRIMYADTATETIKNLNTFPCISGTYKEYPVVADVDGDGSSAILVMGATTTSNTSSPATLRIYKSAGEPWGPARKVWNQYSYNVVNINEDLTVPRYQMNPATRFPGPNGTPGDGDDIQPYNAFFQQQTIRDVTGEPVWLAPDVYLADSSLTVSPDGATATVTFDVVNGGDATFGPPIHFTVYREAVSDDHIIVTQRYEGVVNSGDTIHDVSISFPYEAALHIVVRVNDSVRVAGSNNTSVFPVQAECNTTNNVIMRFNPYLAGTMTKHATLITAENETFEHDGTYENPVTVLHSDIITYKITAINPAAGDLTIRDTLPPYMRYVNASDASPTAHSFTTAHTLALDLYQRQALEWTLSDVTRGTAGTVTFRATPEQGANASQPLYVNQAQVRVPSGSGATSIPTTSTYHQGGGTSVVTFSAAVGGSVYNNEPQVVDYRTSASEGVLVVPDEGYRFTGWSHDEYYSPRGKRIPAQSGILRYDSLTIQGNVDLRAEFAPNRYPIRYCLHEGVNNAANPPDYTVEDAAITLAPPSKPGDVFTGWTGSNGDTPQEEATIPARSTGERVYYANYLHSGREAIAASEEEDTGDKIWAAGNEAYIRTSRAGSIVRVYTPDGVLRRQHTILAPGLTKLRLDGGVYIITLNNNDGRKVVVSD